jgi:hypothetical protein
MAWAGDPREGAVAVFAPDARTARRMAFPVIRGWTDCEWLDLRVKWLRGDCEHLRAKPGPHVNDSPPNCEICELWFADPLIDGLCEGCFEDNDTRDDAA